MKNHWLWMVVGCAIPLLLIFLAPSLGITGYNTFFIFILAMFAIHLLMPMHGGHGRGGHDHSGHNDKEPGNGKEGPAAAPDKKTEGHQHH
ncbi:hypothetical protein JM83_3847 [Gillisia sp. Hel_I_86]|uniref:hypothetical protein n=1 Tax=Gillisia sp. Hel_I_86 TaxID=1249981 RepID=UPI001199D22A|nr:hypothetical protein [Gillisia sp. Hel_I_86]TVZ28703.1 hypothetical protein JM83_3847 [Gillisia sp. Hel_I_86]